MTITEDPPKRGALYHSDRGVFGFQADGAARVYLDTGLLDLQAKLALWSTGIGKTHLAMVAACLLFEDDLIDRVVTVCEIGKLLDWRDDWGRFTDLSVEVYHGDVKRRAKIRGALPEVIVSTFETIKGDGVVFERNSRGKANVRKTPKPGVLADVLMGSRVLFIYDEITAKLSADRSSQNYVAHYSLLEMVRRAGVGRALGLSANVFERDAEGTFNMARLLMPTPPCTVQEFEDQHVAARDGFGKAVHFKNVTPDDCDSGIVPLTQKLAPLVMVKLKTDADVRDQFPKMVEESTHVELGDHHKDFYDRIDAFFADMDDELDQRSGFTLLRQIAGHPMSLLHSQGKYAKAIVELVGAKALAEMGSKKTDEAVEYIRRRVQGGEQSVMFTFFGQSILPILHDRFRQAGIRVSINHGGMSSPQRQESKDAFRLGKTDLFLTSDAGSRGLNLPEALVVANYELPLTWAMYDQRVNRIHRIDSEHPSVSCHSFVSVGTIEEATFGMVVNGNESSDEMLQEWNATILGDEDDGAGFIPAALRRRMLAAPRGSRKRRL